jgi:hypothetical protein
VITTEGEWQPSLLCNLVYLLRDLFTHCTDQTGFLHLANIGIRQLLSHTLPPRRGNESLGLGHLGSDMGWVVRNIREWLLGRVMNVPA